MIANKGDKMDYKIGATSCYIKDFGFSHVVDIPVEAAVEWVKQSCPDVKLCATGHLTAKELTVGGGRDTDATMNGWLNKLFVIVGAEHGNWVALYNHDGRFSIYSKNI